jgi:hypothetical protein
MFNGLRFASGVLLMPLLMRMLSEPDLSIYSQLVFLTGFVYTFDAMFSVTIARNVGYAMSGVADIQSMGIASGADAGTPPNGVLLGQLFSTTRLLYRYLSLGILFILGAGGTMVMIPFMEKSADPASAWQAWIITIAGACLELYTGYWLVFLRGMNKMVLSARLSTAIYTIKLVLSIGLLLAGLGLLAVPISAVITGVFQRLAARKFARANWPANFVVDSGRDKELLARLWPNSWRLGLAGGSMNVMLVGFGAMISRLLDPALFYRYQFSHLIIYSVCMNMAAVWTMVKWPMVMQLRAANDFAGLRRLLWPRVWLQFWSFVALGGAAIFIAPPLLKIVAPTKELLPRFWLCVLALHALLEMQYAFWSTLLTAGNRVPSLWAAVITNLSSLLVAYILVKSTNLGLGAFVLAPLLTSSAFNFWYWPMAGARSLETSWFQYLLHRPR